MPDTPTLRDFCISAFQLIVIAACLTGMVAGIITGSFLWAPVL